MELQVGVLRDEIMAERTQWRDAVSSARQQFAGDLDVAIMQLSEETAEDRAHTRQEASAANARADQLAERLEKVSAELGKILPLISEEQDVHTRSLADLEGRLESFKHRVATDLMGSAPLPLADIQDIASSLASEVGRWTCKWVGCVRRSRRIVLS